MSALTGLMLGCSVPESASSIGRITSIRTCRRTIRSRNSTSRSAPAARAAARFRLSEGRPEIDSAIRAKLRLTRIHLEEDVAKSQHFETSTGIDFNRAGTPLMEIVSEPEIESPEEAFAYLTALQQILIYGGVSDADMEKGQLRCDCNVRAPGGDDRLGVKIEIKNMNSISGVRRALLMKSRQTGRRTRRKIHQSTRRWDDAGQELRKCATKESLTITAIFPIPISCRWILALLTEVRERARIARRKRDRFSRIFG